MSSDNQTKDLEKVITLTNQINDYTISATTLSKSLNVPNNPNRTDIQKALTNINNQKSLLEEKRAILLTRNRMLQLSQDRNNYKQKIIYTLISLIIACFILVLIGYTAFGRNRQ